MEPLSALSLACNITQIIEQSISIGKLVWQIYKKGSIEAYDEIEKNADALSSFTERLQSSIKLSNGSNPTRDEEQLLEIAPDCADIADNLLRELRSLKRSGKAGKLKSFVLTSRAIWRKKEIEELIDRLNEHRNLLETGIIFTIRDRINKLAANQDIKLEKIDGTLKIFLQRLNDDQLWMQRELDQIRDHIDNATNRNAAGVKSFIRDEFDAHQQLEDWRKAREQFLASLEFPDMFQRMEQITSRDRDTFHWVFDETTHGSASDIKQWLLGDSPLFWIHGKAGSGKSTLMRTIWSAPQTREVLESSTQNVRILKHSFWLAGVEMQKSFVGMLCFLLHDVLSEDEATTELLLIKNSEYKKKRSYKQWSIDELRDLFDEVIQQLLQLFTVCLFLDGLDEVSDERDDRSALIDFIQELSSKNKVKVCLSSRFENPWIHIFRNEPQLQLQDHTRGDIEKLVSKRIRKASYKFSALGRSGDEESDLINEIVRKANGVFLWVHLATESIVKIDDLATWDDVKKKVNGIPGNLIDLYESMLQRRTNDPERAKDEAATYLRLCLEGGALGGDRPTRDLYLHHCLVIRSMFRSENNSIRYDHTFEDFKIDYIEVQMRILNICAGMITFERTGYLSNGDLNSLHLPPSRSDEYWSGSLDTVATWQGHASWQNHVERLKGEELYRGWKDYADDIYEDDRSSEDVEKFLTNDDLFEGEHSQATRAVRLRFSHRSVVDFLRDLAGKSFLDRCKMSDLDILKMSVEADMLRYKLGLWEFDSSNLVHILNLALEYQMCHPQTVKLADVAEIATSMGNTIMDILQPDNFVEGITVRAVELTGFFLRGTSYYHDRVVPHLRHNKANGMVLTQGYRDFLLLCAVRADMPDIALELITDGADLYAPFYIPWKTCTAGLILTLAARDPSSKDTWRAVKQKATSKSCQMVLQDRNCLQGFPELELMANVSGDSSLLIVDAASELSAVFSDEQNIHGHGFAVMVSGTKVDVFPFSCQAWRRYYFYLEAWQSAKRLEHYEATLDTSTPEDPIWRYSLPLLRDWMKANEREQQEIDEISNESYTGSVRRSRTSSIESGSRPDDQASSEGVLSPPHETPPPSDGLQSPASKPESWMHSRSRRDSLAESVDSSSGSVSSLDSLAWDLKRRHKNRDEYDRALKEEKKKSQERRELREACWAFVIDQAKTLELYKDLHDSNFQSFSWYEPFEEHEEDDDGEEGKNAATFTTPSIVERDSDFRLQMRRATTIFHEAQEYL